MASSGRRGALLQRVREGGVAVSIGTVSRTSPGFRLVGWIAICTCGAMHTDRRGMQELANEITRMGWRYENRRWRCAQCARRGGA